MIWLSLALAQDTGLLVEEAPPRPWEAPADDELRRHVLGPWPDGYTPAEGFQRGLDVIDPISGRVVEPGNPYIDGEVYGPAAPPEVFAEQESAPFEHEVSDVPSEAPTEELAVVAEPIESPVAGPVQSDVHADREIARQLPVTPEPSIRRAIVAGLLALVMIVLTRSIERGPLTRLPARGLVPLTLRTTVVLLRIGTLAAVLMGGLLLLPKSLNPAPSYVFIGVALAVGWTSRDVLRDFIAGVVLVVEHRLQVDQRVELEDHAGRIESLGARHVDLRDDEGHLVTIPNRVFLDAPVHVDPDPYAEVSVRIHVPLDVDAGIVRQCLEELALLSPYLAPDRAPGVHRDADERDVWVVRGRLVHPRYAAAFRGALVELADEVLATR